MIIKIQIYNIYIYIYIYIYKIKNIYHDIIFFIYKKYHKRIQDFFR